jgi:hypothetical protein
MYDMKKVIRLSESDLNKIVKRIISEDTEDVSEKPITIDLIKKVIMSHLGDHNYDLSDTHTKRKLKQGIDKLAKHYYDMFITRLDYMVEDYDWKEFLDNIEY